MSCSNHNKTAKSCERTSDGKRFDLPRRFTRKQCAKPKGFTMRSSCAPYKGCKIVGGGSRKAPIESATSFPKGTIKGSWVIKFAKNGVPRWVPDVSTELNGFRRLTVDYCAKHIGKPIMLYVREYKEMWPKKNAWYKPSDATYWMAKFVPNGDAVSGKTKIDGWLKSRKPEIKKGAHFYVDGPVIMVPGDDPLPDGVQVDSNGKKLMSFNFMNQEVFVKV
jgi:hypothetical protein